MIDTCLIARITGGGLHATCSSGIEEGIEERILPSLRVLRRIELYHQPMIRPLLSVVEEAVRRMGSDPTQTMPILIALDTFATMMAQAGYDAARQSAGLPIRDFEVTVPFIPYVDVPSLQQ